MTELSAEVTYYRKMLHMMNVGTCSTKSLRVGVVPREFNPAVGENTVCLNSLSTSLPRTLSGSEAECPSPDELVRGDSLRCRRGPSCQGLLVRDRGARVYSPLPSGVSDAS